MNVCNEWQRLLRDRIFRDVKIESLPWIVRVSIRNIEQVAEAFQSRVDPGTTLLPITPGKNVTVLCEVIGMNHLLRNYGYDPAEVFSERLAERIRKKGSSSGPSRGIEYFEHDYE